MSMRTYGGQITGCIIKEKYIDGFIKRYIECHPEEFEKIESPLEKYEEMESNLYCNSCLTRSTPDSGEGFYAQIYSDDPFYNTASIYHLSDLNEWHEDLEMPFIFVESDKSLVTKNILEGKYYKTKEEIIDEFKAKLGRYLPDDFDYEENIGDVEYAVFC